jgi:spermidine/putrescine transport system ATP-binding protein
MSFLYVTHDQEEAFALSDIIIVMNGGRIEQAACPEEIYHAPANAYVADFIGGANLVPGTIRSADAASGKAVIETALGTIEAASSPEVAAGEPACLCIRAEDTQPVGAPEPRSMTFRATVTHVVFQGSVKMVEVAVAGLRIVARLSHDVPAEPGDSLDLAVPGHRLRVVHGTPPEGGGAL